MKSSENILDIILNSNSYVDVFDDLKLWNHEYKHYAKMIHPDICSDDRCHEAIMKLNQYKDQLTNGSLIADEACEINYHSHHAFFKGEESLLERNRANYLSIAKLSGEGSDHFHKYLPETFDVISRDKIRVSYANRTLPLSSIGKPGIKHVNWILSRMLELTCWYNQNGFCHAGINPDSIFVDPVNHGIICTSFYHVTLLDHRLRSLSGKYSSFYPAHVFTNKTATSDIDITLCKKTAMYLLGDESGTGAKLRGEIEEQYLDFLQRVDYHPLDAYATFRGILKKYFITKEFHELKI